MVRNVNIDAVAKKFYPLGVIAVNRATELRGSFVPLAVCVERNAWIGVVN